MSIICDSHVHSTYSGDAQSSIEEMIQKAISLDMKVITFTDHNDFDFPYAPDDEPDMFLLNPDQYLFDIAMMKEQYQNQILILGGVELGLAPELAEKNLAFTKEHAYDFIIASSHLCHGKDPYYPAFYEGRSETEAYREYFESILENIKCFDNFDVYGHLDYVVRYGPNKNKYYKYMDYQNIVDEILKHLIANGKGIEVNTGGFKSGIDATNPCFDILKRYRQLGGEIITVGSDAHHVDYLQSHFDILPDMLREAGFEHYCVFDQRQPKFLLL